MSRMPRYSRLSAVALSVALAVALAPPASAGPDDVPGTAGAATLTNSPEPARPAFYEPPATIPSAPGTIIRSENAPLLLDPLKLSSLLVSSTRVMYSSTDGQGRRIAVTGTVFEPKTPWVGLSPRPVISYAPGTQGMGDRCAPSRQLAESVTEYEAAFIAGLIGRGYAVALTDYQGLGTPGSHTYVAREAMGHSVLDMARAAVKRPGTKLTAKSPIGLFGYSQGGGGAASAAELASTYAPELRIKGAVAGAVPAEIKALAESLDGSLYAAFLNYALVGLSAAYNIDLMPRLNAAGQAPAVRTEQSCTFGLAEFAFQRSENLTADGRPIADYFDEEPFKSVAEDMRIGNRKPAIPVLVNHSKLDDVIPYAVGRQLAKDWCARGANVRFSSNAVPMHVGGSIPSAVESYAFFEARFAGLPQRSGCGSI